MPIAANDNFFRVMKAITERQQHLKKQFDVPAQVVLCSSCAGTVECFLPVARSSAGKVSLT